jgi:hypothetical protein
VDRAHRISERARALAAGCDVPLPGDLRLWALAGDGGWLVDTGAADGGTGADAAWALVAVMEGSLSTAERRRGAHYTPREVAVQVAGRALPDSAPAGPVVDPACGAGALLLGVADRLVALGRDRADVARHLLYGADLDPLAVAVAETAITIWSGGVPPSAGHLVVGDPLRSGGSAWPATPSEGFAAVVGNPPFQGQLATSTARTAEEAERLRERFGAAVGPYVDTAALFLLVGLELAAPGGRIAMVQPQSTAAARDAGPVRMELARRARLVELWAPPERLFAARVHVCVPVLEVGEGDGRSDWSAEIAATRGTPPVDLGRRRQGADPERLAGRARVLASFRDHYYGLVPHVTEAPATGADGDRSAHPLVTAGLIDVGRCGWGEQPVRFAKRSWARPVVDVDAVRASSRRLDGWLDVVLAPKVVVASQTRVVEAAADTDGSWVPSTPTISILPHDPSALPGLLATVCSPPASAWVAARAAGSALSVDTIRVTRGLLEALPLPLDAEAWTEAAEALLAGDLEAFAEAATAMYRLDRATAREVLGWWRPRARSAWLPEGALR